MQHCAKPRSLRRYLLLVFVASLLALAMGAQWWFARGGDKGFLLALARMWVGGKSLYGDMFGPSFPMITWLYALPVYLSHATGVTVAHGLAILAFSCVGLSVWASEVLLKQHPAFAQHVGRQLWHRVVLLFLFIYFVHPLFFGDREHLIIVFLLPFFIRNGPWIANCKFPLPLRLCISAMAVLSVCIKPHAFVMLSGCLLLRMLRERSVRLVFDAEQITIGLLLALYLLLMVCFTPDYFTAVLPMLLLTYSANNKGVYVVQYYATSLFMLGVTLADFRLKYDSPFRRDILYFLGLCFFCLLYVLSNNGWIYTFYPLNTMILLLTVWMWWEFRWLKQNALEKGDNPKQFIFGATACFINMGFNVLATLLLLIGLLYSVFLGNAAPRAPVYDEMTDSITQSHARSFGMISITASFWPDAVEKTGVFMSTRFNNLWMLPKFLTADESFIHKNAWVMSYTANVFAEDLTRNKPEIVFVDDDQVYASIKPLNLIAYFSAYSSFADAWKHYRLLKTIDHCHDAGIENMPDKTVWCRQLVYERSEK